MKYVGIDLGTTYSAVAIINDEGKPVVITNSLEERLTPSVVLFGDNNEQTLVGFEAKALGQESPDNYVSFIKRHMGEKGFSVSAGSKESKQTYSPEMVSAIILKKLAADAETKLGDEIGGVVITVPANFTEPQRQATKQAAEIAGLNVMAIINEPTAAAIAYGLDKANGEKRYIATYDMGGGTFDVSILQIGNGSIEVLASQGNPKLGGFDFDNAILDLVKENLSSKHIDLTSYPDALHRLLLDAENVKIALSTYEEASISVQISNEEHSVLIKRDAFEAKIRRKILLANGYLRQLVKSSGLRYDDLDEIILVGGSTRIPFVRQAIIAETGKEPNCTVNADEAVVIGAAYRAKQLAPSSVRNSASPVSANHEVNEKDNAPVSFSGFARETDSIDEGIDLTPDIPHSTEEPDNLCSQQPTYTNVPIRFVDRTSHGIGVVVVDEDGNESNSIIIPQNTILPTALSETYYTIDDYQTEINLSITQGNVEDIRYVTIIANAEIPIKPKPAQSPIRIKIECDENSIVHVSVYDESDNEKLREITLDRVANLTQRQIEMEKNRIRKIDIG